MGVFGFPLNFNGDTPFDVPALDETSAEYKLCRSTLRNMESEASLPLSFSDRDILLVPGCPKCEVDVLRLGTNLGCVDDEPSMLWSAWTEKLVISLFKRMRGDSMDVVHDGSWVAKLS